MNYYTIVYSTKETADKKILFSFHIQTIQDNKPYFVNCGCETHSTFTGFSNNICEWIRLYNESMLDSDSFDFNFHSI